MNGRFGMLTLAMAFLWAQGQLYALPFNDDMVNNQLKTGQIVRPRPAGVVPRGLLSMRIGKKEDTANFVNPLKQNPVSAVNGERLFQIHCLPCHGQIGKTPYQPGPVGLKIGAPDLTAQLYKDRSDGSIYGTIHFGLERVPGYPNMPAYGWKLTPDEHWDLINYVRIMQGVQ